MPERIQQRRVKGWRLPLGAKSVARPSRFGNPFRVVTVDKHGHYPFGWKVAGDPSVAANGMIYTTEIAARERAVTLFRAELARPSWQERLPELRGLDLACFCPLPAPGETDWCHAAVLIEVSNA